MGKVDQEKNGKLHSFLIRTLSAAVLIGIAFAAIIPGGIPLITVNYILALIGTMEVMRLVGTHKTVLAVLTYITETCLYCLIYFNQKQFLIPLIMLYLLALFVVMVVHYPKFEATKVFVTFGALIYVGLGLSFLYQTRMQVESGKFIVWLIFIGSSVSDTGAYLTGMLIGRHKAFPKLSPKKSVEGCIGGIVFSVLFGIGYNLLLHYRFGVNFLHLWQIALICAIASVCAQTGDLAASAIKRFFDIKDYGKLIPGHGGVMDRFDSIIFVSPLVYYLASAFSGALITK